MSTKPQSNFARAWRKHMLACLFAGVSAVSLGQTVVSPPLRSPVPSPTRTKAGVAKPSSLSDISSAFLSLPPFRTWGPINVRPSIRYGLIHSDGLLRVPGEPTNTTQQSLTLSFQSELGKHWALNYAAARTWYSSRLLADSTSHTASLSGGISKGDWEFGFSQSYSSTSLTLVETGQQTPEISYSTGGIASYQMGRRSSFDLSVSRNIRDSELPADAPGGPVPDVEQWSGSMSVHYTFSPKLDVGIGMQFGYDSISISSDMTSSRPQVTLNWHPTQKLSFSASGGLETREFESDTEDLDSDVYSASASYQPTVYTSLSLFIHKSVAPSYFANQLSKSSGWGGTVRQRFFRRFYATAGASHGKTTYVVTNRDFVVGRDDEFDSINFSVSTTFLRRGSIALSYQESRNSSTDTGFGFKSSQFGMEIEYRF